MSDTKYIIIAGEYYDNLIKIPSISEAENRILDLITKGISNIELYKVEKAGFNIKVNILNE